MEGKRAEVAIGSSWALKEGMLGADVMGAKMVNICGSIGHDRIPLQVLSPA